MYLRDIMEMVSCHWLNGQSGCYSFLAQRLLYDTHHKVTFLSLNYDTLFERALQDIEPTFKLYDDERNFDIYLKRDFGASIIKLHGSSDWYSDLLGSQIQTQTLVQTVMNYGELSGLQPQYRVNQIARPHNGKVHEFDYTRDSIYMFPIMTLPLANKTSEMFVCPKSHIDTAKEELPHCTKILIIGASGLDTHVLEFLKENLSGVRLVHFVGRHDIEDVAGRFKSVIPALAVPNIKEEVFDGGFRNYVEERFFEHFIDS